MSPVSTTRAIDKAPNAYPPRQCDRRHLVAVGATVSDPRRTTIMKVAANGLTCGSPHPLPVPTITPNTVLPNHRPRINAPVGSPASEASHLQCR